MIDLVPVKSSNLKSVGHEKEANELHVEFHGGSVFAYDGVSAELHERLMKAESIGKFFHKEIKNGGFKFRQIK